MNDEPLAWGGLPFKRKLMRPATLRWFQAQNQIREVLPGIFLDVRAPDTPQIRAAATELVIPAGAIVCGPAAAWIHGISTTALGEPELPRITWRDQAPGFVEVGGVRVTSPMATAVELAMKLHPPFALSAIDAFLRNGAELEQLRSVADRYEKERGSWQARKVLEYADGRAASPGESWLRLRLLDAGFAGLDLQHRIDGPDGVYRVDIAYPDQPVDGQRLALEYDSDQHHSQPAEEARDERRRTALEKLGWRVISVRRTDLWGSHPALELAVGGFFCQEPRLPRRW